MKTLNCYRVHISTTADGGYLYIIARDISAVGVEFPEAISIEYIGRGFCLEDTPPQNRGNLYMSNTGEIIFREE